MLSTPNPQQIGMRSSLGFPSVPQASMEPIRPPHHNSFGSYGVPPAPMEPRWPPAGNGLGSSSVPQVPIDSFWAPQNHGPALSASLGAATPRSNLGSRTFGTNSVQNPQSQAMQPVPDVLGSAPKRKLASASKPSVRRPPKAAPVPPKPVREVIGFTPKISPPSASKPSVHIPEKAAPILDPYGLASMPKYWAPPEDAQ
jgi:hypothetical protein